MASTRRARDCGQRIRRGSILASLAVWAFAPPAPASSDDPIVAGNSGSARWTIPIEVPPGAGGLAPTLALVWSSGAGDGPFGVGWHLPLGAIACSTRRYGVPHYISTPGTNDACPEFELDGELLIAGSDHYHTVVESFQRVRNLGNAGWEVTSPNGTIRRYGQDENSQIVGPSGNVARWLLSSTTDPFGNRISYAYDSDPSTPVHNDPVGGTAYIRQIAYGPGARRVVEFDYGPRPDPIHDFAGGVERDLAYRATEIRVESNDFLHSRYRLGYDLGDLNQTPTAADYSTDRSRLSWVQRLGSTCTSDTPLTDCTVANGKALPPQTFRYRDANDSGGGSLWTGQDAYRIPFGNYSGYGGVISKPATSS